MKTTVSKEQRKHILKVLEENRGDYERTARELLISATIVREVDIIENKKYNATPTGRGRPEMEQYIVAVEKVHKPWDNKLPEIREARRQYDDGTHEMTTGRDGMNKILYIIPRQKPTTEGRPYFAKLEVI